MPADRANGVIIAQGGRFGGWSLYAKDGRAKFHYNVRGIKYYAIEGTAPVPTGTTQVRMEFAYAGGGMAKVGTVALYYDGQGVCSLVVVSWAAAVRSSSANAWIGPSAPVAVMAPRAACCAAQESSRAVRVRWSEPCSAVWLSWFARRRRRRR